MPAYGAPGAAASDAIENFMLQQQQQKHMQLMDQLALTREKRLAEREMLETTWAREDRQKQQIEKQISGLQRGDHIPTELKLAAAKYHLPLPQEADVAGAQFLAPGGQPETQSGVAPGGYLGTPQQQYGAGLRSGKYASPEAALGGAIEAGMPPAEIGAIERFVQPKTTKWLPGSLSGSQLSDGSVDIYGSPVNPNLKYRVSEDRKQIVPQAEKTQKLYWESPRTGNVYEGQEDGSWQSLKDKSKIAKDAHFIKEPPPDLIKYLQTEEGYQTVPSRGATRGAPSGVRPPVAVPSPVAAAGTSTSAPTAAATVPSRLAVQPGGITARPVTGPDGKPLYGAQGAPLTEEGAAPFAAMLAAGVSPTTLMSMGMAGSMRAKVANLAAQYRTGKKAIPPDLIGFVSKVADKATTIQTLKFLQKQEATASTSAKIAKENLNLALEAGEKVGRSDALFINRLTNKALRDAGIDVTGSTDVGKLSDFETKIYTAIREYAKVASGSSGSVAGLSEGATREATALLNSAQSPAAFKAAVEGMEADMDNIIKGWNRSYQDKIDSLDDTKAPASDAYAEYLKRTKKG